MTCCGTPVSPEESDAVNRLIAGRLVAFMAILRDNAFAVGLREAQDAALVVARGFADRPGRLRSAFKHLFSARRQDWEKFDTLFDAFWLGRGVKRRAVLKTASEHKSSPAGRRLDGQMPATAGMQGSDQIPAGNGTEPDPEARGRAEGASQRERLEGTDFRKLSDPDEIREAHAIAARLAKAMRTRLTRRDAARRRGERLDMRRTIHANIGNGGVPIQLMMRRRRRKPLRLVVLLDASGSMSPYTGVFIRFIHGVLDEFREAEAFLFDTRLAHVSAAMRERDPARALDRLSLMAQSSGGGTRIGESLATFNRSHAARVIHSRTCVMIVSDGYETGDASMLGREMAALSRRCRRIVWLNPMIGWDGYTPAAAGMRAALPHVDLFAPANTLRSLAELEPYLARL